MQTFQYPNLIAGTDQWTDWWTPEVGKDNSTVSIATIALPRPIAQDDVACVSVDLEFDGLDLTADKASMAFQGIVEGSWHFVNPFTTGLKHMGRDVFDGAMELTNTFRIDSYSYSTDVDSYQKSPVGRSKFGFGLRVNYCGGGRSVCGVSWSNSARRAHRTHGRQRVGRCGLSERG